MNAPSTLDALIVGAGPTGLSMALEIQRHGCSVRIVDKAPVPSDKSKALVVQCRTLEVFESMGVIADALATGHRLVAMNPHFDGKSAGQLRFNAVDSPHPFPLILEQSDTERILIQHLTSRGITVERQWELTGFDQDADGVTSRLRHADGRTEEIRSRWLVGCDGAHSAVRHTLGLRFDGTPYEEDFLLADACVDWSLPYDEGQGFITREGAFAVIPIRKGFARIIAICRQHSVPLGHEPVLADFQRLADRFAPPGTVIRDPVWLAQFHTHRRIASQFCEGRVFLAGDAAHIHSPAGGQGMNTGIQDAFNLAWKLALVTKGAARPEILDSYHAERHPVAVEVLRLTDRMFRGVLAGNAFTRFVQKFIAPWVLRQPWLMRRFAEFVSEIQIGYPSSPIVGEDETAWFFEGPRAGGRAPDVDGLGREDGSVTRFFDIFREPVHHLLLMSGELQDEPTRRALEKAAEVAVARCGANLRVWAVVASNTKPFPGVWSVPVLLDSARAAHRKYGVAGASIFLVRPDGYLAWRGAPDDGHLAAYLETIFVGK